MNKGSGKDDRLAIHRGADHSSPYPVSRLAPGFGLVDLAHEIEQADQVVAGRLGAQLEVIAEQVRSLQAQARRVLEQAREDQRLHHARCTFQRKAGHIYHLYEEPDGSLAFSMLSPDDWGGDPPRPFRGSYRLQSDLSWTPAENAEHTDDSRRLVARLLDRPLSLDDSGA
jgi:hypothetical protein